MSLLPDQIHFELIFRAWLHSQIAQLSVDALRAGVFVRLTHFDFHDIQYLIENRGRIAHYSPEEAYAILHFYLALDELNRKDRVNASKTYPL